MMMWDTDNKLMMMITHDMVFLPTEILFPSITGKLHFLNLKFKKLEYIYFILTDESRFYDKNIYFYDKLPTNKIWNKYELCF